MKVFSLISELNQLGKLNKYKNVVYSLSDQIFSIGAVFMINMVLARTETEADYGMFVLVYSLFTITSGFHNALIIEPYTVFASGRYKDIFLPYLQYILRINLVVGLFLSLCLLMITAIIWLWFSDFYSSMLLALSAGILFVVSGALFKRVFYVQHDSFSAGVISTLYFISILVGVLYLVEANILSGMASFILLSIGWVIVSPIFFRKYSVRKYNGEFIKAYPDYWSKHWRYSRWVLATAVVYPLITQGYYWITAGMLSVESVAQLKAVQNIVLPINLFFISISLLALPRMSLVYQNELLDGLLPLLKKLLFVLVGSAVVFMFSIWLVGRELLSLIYDDKYNASFELLYIISLVPIFFAIGNAFNDALKAMEKPDWVFKAYVIGGVVTLLVGIPLVEVYGLVGAAWGMVVSAAAYGLVLCGGFFALYLRVGKI